MSRFEHYFGHGCYPHDEHELGEMLPVVARRMGELHHILFDKALRQLGNGAEARAINYARSAQDPYAGVASSEAGIYNLMLTSSLGGARSHERIAAFNLDHLLFRTERFEVSSQLTYRNAFYRLGGKALEEGLITGAEYGPDSHERLRDTGILISELPNQARLTLSTPVIGGGIDSGSNPYEIWALYNVGCAEEATKPVIRGDLDDQQQAVYDEQGIYGLIGYELEWEVKNMAGIVAAV